MSLFSGPKARGRAAERGFTTIGQVQQRTLQELISCFGDDKFGKWLYDIGCARDESPVEATGTEMHFRSATI